MAFLSFPMRRCVWLAWLLAGICCAGEVSAQEGGNKEYQVKAAFIYNFAQFVKWPSNAFSSADAPLRIGVLGDDPFDGALEDIIRGETVDGHRLVVVHSHNIDDLRDCQVIFVARSEQPQTGQILAACDDRPILTVSEIERFAQAGGAIDFYLSNGKIRFDINAAAARHRGLKISSQLLALGRIVGGG